MVQSLFARQSGKLLKGLNTGVSLVAHMVKNLPAMQETRVRSLGQEDPLEKEMATHSNILAWRIPWTEESGRLQSMGSQELDATWQLNYHIFRIIAWLSLLEHF